MKLKTLNKYPQFQMSWRTTRIMMSLHIAQDHDVQESYEAMGVWAGAGVAIMLARIERAQQKVTIDKKVIVFVSTLIDRPGVAVLWGHTLYRRALDNDNTYTWDRFIYDFPNGFPDATGLSLAWDAQKTDDGRNYLDTQEAWS